MQGPRLTSAWMYASIYLLTAFVGQAAFGQLPGTLPSSPSTPPGTIVIRPKGLPYQQEPDKPGHIRIRPKDAIPGETSTTPGTMPTTREPKLIASGTQPPAQQPTQSPLTQSPIDKPAEPEAPAGEGKIVHESWDVLFVQGYKVGYFHVIVREYTRDGQTFLYGIKTQKLTYARFGQPVELWGEDSTLETTDGRVLTTRMRQRIGKEQNLSLAGKVERNQLVVDIEGVARDRETIPFPDGVLGVAAEAKLMKNKQPKPGDRFEYLWYEGRLNRVIRYQVEAKNYEDLTIYENRPPVKALKVDVRMEPVGGIDLSFTSWVDATTYEPIKVQADVPALGGIATILRTTQEFATRPATKLMPLNESQSIALDQAVPNMHSLSKVVYRISYPGKPPATRNFTEDERQRFSESNSNDANAETLLTVVAVRKPTGRGEAVNPPAEYLSDSFFIDWDNPEVKTLARQAIVGLSTNASTWQRALAIERWVNRNMKAVEFTQAMASCSATAKNLTGDCTEYAMLSVGLCRAVGVPARTALGLVYAPTRDGKAMFAFHMWYEVFVDGEWIALDATLGLGCVGPGHLKIADASWAGEKSLAPILPVQALLRSKPTIQVLDTVP